MTAKDLWLKDLDKNRIYDDDDNDDHQIKHQQVKLEKRRKCSN
nr:3430_t:CDS:2 [Entrophospora candida]